MPKSRNTRPLQDITDRFVPAVEPVPTPRPHRKAKAPGGAFGAKLRAAKAPAIPSSLPPSSPPSASSRDPELHNDHQTGSSNYGDENIDPNLELPQFDQDPGPSNVFDEDADPLDTSDPFGFFVVEKKLKALRARPSYIEKQQHQYHAAPPPPIDTALIPDHPATPPTPRKRRGKRKAIASLSLSSPDVFSPRTTSLPSSPSPSKPTSRKGKEKASTEADKSGHESDMGSTDLALTPQPRRPAKRPRRQDTSKETAETPDKPVLRRSVRRTATAINKAKATDDGDRKTVRRKRTAATGSRVRPSGEKHQGKGKGKASASQEDDDQQEKWEQERQVRLEYFRKLQDYQVEEENVYVV